MEAFRHILKTPVLGRFLVPWDALPVVCAILVGYLTDLNLVLTFFFLVLAMTGLFWIRKTGEGSIRGRVLYALRKRRFLVE